MRTALAAVAQCRQCELGAEKDAGQIDAAEPAPIAEAGLFDAHPEKDAGIVDENVEAAELARDRRHTRRPVLLPGHVEMAVGGFTAGALECADGFAAAFVEHVADRDLGS